MQQSCFNILIYSRKCKINCMQRKLNNIWMQSAAQDPKSICSKFHFLIGNYSAESFFPKNIDFCLGK